MQAHELEVHDRVLARIVDGFRRLPLVPCEGLVYRDLFFTAWGLREGLHWLFAAANHLLALAQNEKVLLVGLGKALAVFLEASLGLLKMNFRQPVVSSPLLEHSELEVETPVEVPQPRLS